MRKLVLAIVAGLFGLPDSAEATAVEFEAMEERAGPQFDMETPFKPSIDAMTDVDATLKAATAHGKLAMIVMGANWCHDSIGLIKHMNTPEVGAVLKEKYEVRIVDVGYLDHSLNVATRFGLPVIYGTPTVLIVEPTSQQLLNIDTVNVWRDSASMGTSEIVDYLASQSSDLPEKEEATGELKRLMDEISQFEGKQAARIYGGFAIVGPMLAAEHRPDHFGKYWSQLRNLRYSITEDLKNLRDEAHTRVAKGETGITLEFPDYPAFEWEKERETE